MLVLTRVVRTPPPPSLYCPLPWALSQSLLQWCWCWQGWWGQPVPGELWPVLSLPLGCCSWRFQTCWSSGHPGSSSTPVPYPVSVVSPPTSPVPALCIVQHTLSLSVQPPSSLPFLGLSPASRYLLPSMETMPVLKTPDEVGRTVCRDGGKYVYPCSESSFTVDSGPSLPCLSLSPIVHLVLDFLWSSLRCLSPRPSSPASVLSWCTRTLGYFCRHASLHT